MAELVNLASVLAAVHESWARFLWSSDIIQVCICCRAVVSAVEGLKGRAVQVDVEDLREYRWRFPNVSGRMLCKDGGLKKLDLRAVQCVELPAARREVDLRWLPRHASICWYAPTDIEASEDALEDELPEGKLLGLRLGVCVEEGGFRSPIFLAPTGSDRSELKMQVRWFPVGNALCPREGGCSLYLIAEADMEHSSMAITFELGAGRLRRVLHHDFAHCPQWGSADFGDLAAELGGQASDGVWLQVTLLEVPAAFRLCRSPDPCELTWRIENWSGKQGFGPAAYVSEQLGLEGCPSMKLLVGLCPSPDSEDLVEPRPPSGRPLALQPLALFVGAAPGTACRFSLQAGTRRCVFYHTFSFLEAFVGRRIFLSAAQDAAVEGDALEVILKLLGDNPGPAGQEEQEVDTLPAV
ncbi:unnamed protein product [Symbiodinium sp. CCMP2592]|nr:unnamed protein product [Symbiodinium sp. CCMP2592]